MHRALTRGFTPLTTRPNISADACRLHPRPKPKPTRCTGISCSAADLEAQRCWHVGHASAVGWNTAASAGGRWRRSQPNCCSWGWRSGHRPQLGRMRARQRTCGAPHSAAAPAVVPMLAATPSRPATNALLVETGDGATHSGCGYACGSNAGGKRIAPRTGSVVLGVRPAVRCEHRRQGALPGRHSARRRDNVRKNLWTRRCSRALVTRFVGVRSCRRVERCGPAHNLASSAAPTRQ